MKKIHTVVKAFAICALASAFFSCADIMEADYIRNETPASETENGAEGAVLRFSVKDLNQITSEDFSKIENARTVLPSVTINDLTDFTVKGYRSGYGTEKNLGTYADITELSQTQITLPHSMAGQIWNFELTARKGGTIFRSYVEEVELKVKNAENPDTEVNFVLSLYGAEEGTGNFSYTLDYSSDFSAAAVTNVNVKFVDIENSESCPISEQNFSEANLTNKKFTLTGSNVPKGKYRAKITLYSGEVVAGYWQDIIQVYPDLTSSKVQNISLKKFIKFNYVLNAAGDATLEFAGDEFIKKTAEMTLPSPKRSEYVFAGWYTDSGLTEPFDAASVSENQMTVYAKWGQKNFTVSIDTAASVISAAIGGTEEDPVVVKFTGAYSTGVFQNIRNAFLENENTYFFIDMSEVASLTEIPTVAFDSCRNLTGVTIPDSVTYIGTYAFSDCSSLKEISLPENLQKIDQYAFQHTGITQVIIPQSVQELNRAFYEARELESVTFEENSSLTKIGSCCFASTNISSIVIPDSVTTLEWGSFNGCPLTSVTLGSGITEIQNETFMYNSSLTSIIIPEGITSIGDSAFYGAGLTSVNIPDSVTTIGNYAFCDCQHLKTVTIGRGITTIGEQAFRYCPIESFTIDPLAAVQLENGILYNSDRTKIITITDSSITELSVPATITELPLDEIRNLASLTSITVDSGCTEYSGSDGVLFSKDGTVLLIYPDAKAGASYTIPADVTIIENCAFANAKNLTSIVSDKTWALKNGDGIFILSDPQQLCRYTTSTAPGYRYTIFDGSSPAVTVYDSENLDFASDEYTITIAGGEDYNYVVYRIQTAADEEYIADWFDGHNTWRYSNIPNEFTPYDSKIFIYDEQFNQIGYTDDEAYVEFTAAGTTSYVAVVNYGSGGACNCAFRVYKK